MANDKKVKKEGKEKKHFFKDFKNELKKVTWPTGKQLVNNTIAVITIVLITAAIVFVLDLCFEMLNKYGINKLKSAINNNETTVVEENNDSTDSQVVENTEITDDTENTETTEDTTNGQEETDIETTPSPEAE